MRRPVLMLCCLCLLLGAGWLWLRDDAPAARSDIVVAAQPNSAPGARSPDAELPSADAETAPIQRSERTPQLPNEAHAAAGDAPEPARADEAGSHVRGRLLDADGVPLAGVRIATFNWFSANARETARTDAEGYFDLGLMYTSGLRWVREWYESQSELELVAQHGGYLHRHTIPLPADWIGRTWTLRDWRLAADRSLAFVQVFEAGGARIDPLAVELQVRIDGGAVSGPDSTLHAGGLRWVGAELTAELRGLERPKRLDLRAQLGWSPPSPWVQVEPLGSRVDLRLAEGGGARGSVVVDEEFGASRVRVRLRSREHPELLVPDASLRVLALDETRGDWVIVGLAPGPWTARFVHASDGALLAELDLPEVSAGRVAVADELDLRGAVTRWEVALRASNGGAIESGRVALIELADLERDSAGAEWAHSSVSYGRAFLRTRRAPQRLAAHADGYRPTELDVLPADRVVVLEPAWPGVLRIEGGVPFDALDWLDAPAAWKAPALRVPLRIDGDRCRVEFPGAGRYRLHARDAAWSAMEFSCPDGGPTAELLLRPRAGR
jgi:hypothetical protein